jgi:hypothetical protein
MEELLFKARERNRALGLTGILLDSDRFYFQILEGPGPTVREMMARIEKDGRHADVLNLVIDEAAEDRIFDNWSMAHYMLEPDSPELPGAVTAPLSQFLADMQERKGCESIRMLEDFVESHWTGWAEGAAGNPELHEYLVQRA